MPRAKRYYLHTINGRPATFDGDQLVFATVQPHWQDEPTDAVLRTSLTEVHADWRASADYRRRLQMDKLGEYGYVLIMVPHAAR